jgi:hypothetical protein
MEIRQRTAGDDLSDHLRGVIAELESQIDKSDAHPITIANSEEYVAVAEKLKADKAINATVEEKLKPFTSLAFRVHRFLTGKQNEFCSYGIARMAYADRALVAYDNEKEREKRETEEKLREQNRKEEEERRAREAAEMKKRGNFGAARSILAAPIRDSYVEVQKETPKVAGQGFTEKYVAHCEDEDALILAIARPAIMREVAAMLRPMLKKKTVSKTDMVNAILAASDQQPVIPSPIFLSTKASRDALDTAISKIANSTGGKIQWPGVTVELDKKTTTRR